MSPKSQETKTFQDAPTRNRADKYAIHRFWETDDGTLVEMAWRIHASGYESMGFVKDDAITHEGYMSSSIDKARGDNVDYYVAHDAGQADYLDAATVRKINLKDGETVVDLPAYQLCQESLYADEHEYLLNIPRADERVKEMGALARTPESSPLSVFELLRDTYQQALGRDEVWFFTIVASTYDSLVDNFGATAMRQIGEPVAINDTRVMEEIRLVPSVVEIDSFVSRIYHSAIEQTDARRRDRQLRSFIFFCDGLSDDQIGVELAAARQVIYEGHAA